jgi:hypothetical protein
VASNFNGVEAISEGSSPDGSSFTEKYIYDLTQGPAASISAGAGASCFLSFAFLLSPRASKKEEPSSTNVSLERDSRDHASPRRVLRPHQAAGRVDADRNPPGTRRFPSVAVSKARVNMNVHNVAGLVDSIVQVNFLADLRKHFPTHNGYVVLTGREPSFPKVGSAKYDRLFGKVLVGYHHNVQVCPP